MAARVRGCRKLDCPVHDEYGQTECGMVLADYFVGYVGAEGQGWVGDY